MLILKPSCEHCNTLLPPDSTEARICSFECTFCADCVEQILHNVCPNCGGGFCVRPVRPSKEWKPGAFLGQRPASSTVVYKPVDREVHETFSANLRHIPPEQR